MLGRLDRSRGYIAAEVRKEVENLIEEEKKGKRIKGSIKVYKRKRSVVVRRGIKLNVWVIVECVVAMPRPISSQIRSKCVFSFKPL